MSAITVAKLLGGVLPVGVHRNGVRSPKRTRTRKPRPERGSLARVFFEPQNLRPADSPHGSVAAVVHNNGVDTRGQRRHCGGKRFFVVVAGNDYAEFHNLCLCLKYRVNYVAIIDLFFEKFDIIFMIDQLQLKRRKEVSEQLKAKLAESLDLDIDPQDIHEDIALVGSGLGLDSLDILEIVSCAESAFGVKIPEGDLSVLRSFNTLVDFIITARKEAV